MKGLRTGIFFSLLLILSGLAEAIGPIRDALSPEALRWVLIVSSIAGLVLRSITTTPPAWRTPDNSEKEKS
jgi:hypothetical protein